MSGGHFNYQQDMVAYTFAGEWRDREIDALFADLFGSEDDWRSGLVGTLDLWLAGDSSEETYRREVQKFKEKWFRRTPRNRTQFYADQLQKECDRMKGELTGVWPDDRA